jgi:hemerythrin superfamily protein
MTIYDVLKDDHHKVKHLLEQLEETSEGAVNRRATLINRLFTEVITHARAEEIVFYDTLKDIDAARHMALKAGEEHSTVESLLRELVILDPGGERFAAKFEVLKENLLHHIEEEEDSVFESAKLVLAPEEAEVMGDYFKEIKNQISDDGNTLNVRLSTPRYQDIVGTYTI